MKKLNTLLFIILVSLSSSCLKKDNTPTILNENDKTTIKNRFNKLIEITSELNKNTKQEIASKIKTNSKLKYLYENADWNNIKYLDSEKTNKGYILIKNDNKFFKHTYHGQRAIVFKEINSEYTFSIIEIVSKSISDSTNTDLIEKSLTNILNEKSIPISSDEYYILYYDDEYKKIKTYSNDNNKWVKSNIDITNNLASNVKNRIANLNTVAAEPNCETWYTILYWYDLESGIILGYTVLSIANSCDENYSSTGNYGSYSNEPIDINCVNSSITQVNNFLNQITSSNDFISETIISENSNKIEKILKWKCANTILGGIYSYEKGTLKIIPNTTPEKKYEWESIEHQSISFNNLMTFGTITCNTVASAFTLGKYNAALELAFTVKYQIGCGDFNFNSEKTLTSNTVFNAISSTSINIE